MASRTKILSGGTCLLAALMIASSSHAVPIALTNAGFEDPVLANGAAGTTNAVTGWQLFTLGAGALNTKVFNPTGTGSAIPDAVEGSNVLQLNGVDGAVQTTSSTFAEGTYTLTASGTTAGFSGTGTNALQVLIQNGNTGAILAQQSLSPGVAWAGFSVELEVLAGNANIGNLVSVGLRNNTVNDAAWAFFDNVQLDFVPVPEPGSAALLGLGALAMLGRRGRKVA